MSVFGNPSKSPSRSLLESDVEAGEIHGEEEENESGYGDVYDVEA